MTVMEDWDHTLATRLSTRMQQAGQTIRVAFVNRKGGTGKSSNLVNAAGTLALRGHHVCIVDVDAQGGSHAARLLGLGPEDGLFNALVGLPDGENQYLMLPVEDHLRQVPLDSYLAPQTRIERIGDSERLVIFDVPSDRQHVGTIAVLPAGMNTLQIPYLIDDVNRFDRLLDDIAALGFNVILIDSGPSMGLFDGVVLEAMDGFVIVTELEALSLFALGDMYPQIERAGKARQARGLPPNRLFGVLPNKYRGLREHVDNLSALAQTFGEKKVWSPMRQLKLYAKMAKFGQTIQALDVKGPESLEVVQMTNRFESEVEEWIVQLDARR